LHRVGGLQQDAWAGQDLVGKYAVVTPDHQYGTEEQKQRFLPRVAKGEPGAIVITEPFAGTDAAGIETAARREGDAYLLNGKKRYIVAAGVADRHMVYARTSNAPEDIKNYRHLTGFIVEKGTPGLSGKD
jgi:alkylation response protein AidB-like acyl-CoA dehydrogenase